MDRQLEKLYHKNLALTKSKVRDSVKPDNLIVQCIGTIEELDRAANMLSKRFREWYELTNPEYSRSIQDHASFIRLVTEGADKRIDDSMGKILPAEDMHAMLELGKKIDSMYRLRKHLEEYVKASMESLCPNTLAVAGPLVGAKLLAHAGTLKRLSEMTSSTVQILGAEKALFRHMKTGAKAPKHGVILQHPLLQKAKMKDRGKVARALADKISMAAKIDYFKGQFIGDKLIRGLEEKFK